MTAALKILERTVQKFEQRSALTVQDKQAIYRLPFELRTFEANRYITREGDRSPCASLIVTGLAFRQKVTKEGARQILSVHIPGDFVDLENALLTVADHSVQALTRCEVARVPCAAITELIETHARVAHAMWIDTLIDASRYREWIVNVGRRDSRTAACHLLCEFARRLEIAGMTHKGGYEFPMTQEQFADALGISPVHVNRVVRDLELEGLIAREKRFLRIPDWHALSRAAGFNELYLHLDQGMAVVP